MCLGVSWYFYLRRFTTLPKVIAIQKVVGIIN
jgi:hypothetical protein